MGDEIFQVLAHRGLWRSPNEQNSLIALEAAFQKGYGVETDLRAFKGELYLSHDSIHDTGKLSTLSDLLLAADKYETPLLFINVKEDGLLPMLTKCGDKLMRHQAVFFDYSVPELIAYSRVFPSQNLATRISDFETSPCGAEFCDWFWLDGFQRDLTQEELIKVSESFALKKLALVSSELHGRAPEKYWQTIRKLFCNRTRAIALCTDLPKEFIHD